VAVDPLRGHGGQGSFLLDREASLSKDAEKTMNQTPQLARNQPEKKIRSGAISATIWANEQDTPNGKVLYKTVSFERSYKDKDGKWQGTSKLRSMDIPRAVLVLNKAYEYLALGEEVEAEH
jgi:hypothetical protein